MTSLLKEVDAERGIVWLSINRPDALNAIDVSIARELHAAVLPLADDPKVRCVVLRGVGRAFAAGGDVGSFAEDFSKTDTLIGEILDAMNPAIEILRSINAPVLASVQGAAAGAGLSLVAASDIAIAAKNTRLIMAYDRIGASPDCGASRFIPRMLGIRRAAQMMMLSETLTADMALDWGLLNFVVADDQLAAETESLAIKLAAGPTRSYGEYKRLVEASFSTPLHEQLEAEREGFQRLTRTQDFRIGVDAFLAKKKPDFKGS